MVVGQVCRRHGDPTWHGPASVTHPYHVICPGRCPGGGFSPPVGSDRRRLSQRKHRGVAVLMKTLIWFAVLFRQSPHSALSLPWQLVSCFSSDFCPSVFSHAVPAPLALSVCPKDARLLSAYFLPSSREARPQVLTSVARLLVIYVPTFMSLVKGNVGSMFAVNPPEPSAASGMEYISIRVCSVQE